MPLREENEPREIEIRCKGDKCHRINAVVSPEIIGSGNITVGIVGEAPYIDEVEAKRPFVGRSGRLLREYFDYDLYTYYIVNSINCLTYEYDTTIKPSEMTTFEKKKRLDNCRTFVHQVLDQLEDGSVVMALGVFARLSLFGEKVPVSVFPRVFETENKTLNVFINHHPAYLIYNNSAIQEFEDILFASGVFAKREVDENDEN